MVVYACVLSCCMHGQPSRDFAAFRDAFVTTYKKLEIRPAAPSYADNLQNIPRLPDIQQQLAFFRDAEKKIAGFANLWLGEEELLDLDMMKFETNLNLQRLALEKKWAEEKPSVIPSGNIYQIPHGKEWYTYLLNRYTGENVNADEIFLNDSEEATRLGRQIDTLAAAHGLSLQQLIIHMQDRAFAPETDTGKSTAVANAARLIHSKMPLLFNQPSAFTVGFADEKLLPGNHPGEQYHTHVTSMYLYKLLPGAYYQQQLAARAVKSPVQALFRYDNFTNAWAAYAETLGKEMDVYSSFYEEISQLQCALLRCVRSVLDIGINFYGWADDKAINTWQAYMPAGVGNVQQEIYAVKHLPAHAVACSYGCMLFVQWKKELQARQGSSFNIRDFHDRLLKKGALPFFMVKKNVFRKSASAHTSGISTATR
ncbi:DUF885 family protein [Panacibacter sp. DH6]|uniref:DUF885 family protein n=1 Tax=Panacibacter microcysteis TaxID=2793269 RepID=A0A931GZR3_9BACT|nr:DUF885 family protein [Panacibacter microcysteis]MBG9378343.1 DUF885 family protein [Panacibacter microcysteis]